MMPDGPQSKKSRPKRRQGRRGRPGARRRPHIAARRRPPQGQGAGRASAAWRRRTPRAARRARAEARADGAPSAPGSKSAARRRRARRRRREPPGGSAASYPPEGLPLSTFGDGGLNCRVRDGTGCAPSSMAADPTGGSGRHPGGQHSAQDRSHLSDRPDSMKLGSRRARPISTARLSTSPCLQLRPIQLLV